LCPDQGIDLDVVVICGEIILLLPVGCTELSEPNSKMVYVPKGWHMGFRPEDDCRSIIDDRVIPPNEQRDRWEIRNRDRVASYSKKNINLKEIESINLLCLLRDSHEWQKTTLLEERAKKNTMDLLQLRMISFEDLEVYTLIDTIRQIKSKTIKIWISGGRCHSTLEIAAQFPDCYYTGSILVRHCETAKIIETKNE
jgi:uncharacterized protein (UPF0248 family)